MDAPASPALATLIAFAGELRARGVPVSPDAVTDFVAAVSNLGFAELYACGCCTLVRRQRDLATFDAVFVEFFARGDPALRATPLPIEPVESTLDFGTEERGGPSETLELGAASRADVLREKRFADCTDHELEAIRALLGALRFDPPRRRTRRHVAAKRGALDVRRTVRASLRTAGDPVSRIHRTRASTERRLILLLDVSASMSPYSRALLMFAHVVLSRHPSCEAFCFGTRLTRLTGSLALRDPREALAAVSAAVFDRDAGTRIGDSLRQFLHEHGHAGLARGAIVVICSDGLEIGDPQPLADAMAHLARLAQRIVWLNPLKEDPRYEPITQGMVAALPAIDVLASGHNLRSLEELGHLLERSLADVPELITVARSVAP